MQNFTYTGFKNIGFASEQLINKCLNSGSSFHQPHRVTDSKKLLPSCSSGCYEKTTSAVNAAAAAASAASLQAELNSLYTVLKVRRVCSNLMMSSAVVTVADLWVSATAHRVPYNGDEEPAYANAFPRFASIHLCYVRRSVKLYARTCNLIIEKWLIIGWKPIL